MDKKDEIILQQLEVIRTMTEHNLPQHGRAISGARPSRVSCPPKSPPPPRPPAATPVGSADGKMTRPAVRPARPPADSLPPRLRKRRRWSRLPKENMEDLLAELDSYMRPGAR